MSLLATITSGVKQTGIRAIIMGQEKMGKTTMVCGAPKPLLIPCEVGFAGVAVDKTKMIESLEELWQLLDEIIGFAQRGQFPYKTLAFDSVTAIERLIHDFVLRQDPGYKPGQQKKGVTMESALGGYGKAYNLANDYFIGLLSKFDQLAVNAGINILLTAHTFSAKVVDPTVGEYDSWDLLLHSPKNQKTYGKRKIATQWADLVGFLYEPVYISQANEKAMARATSQGKGRVLAVSRTPSYTAGNRYGILGELPIPAPPANGWNVLAHALYNQTQGQLDVFTR